MSDSEIAHMIHAWHLWSPRLSAGREATASAAVFIDRHLRD